MSDYSKDVTPANSALGNTGSGAVGGVTSQNGSSRCASDGIQQENQQTATQFPVQQLGGWHPLGWYPVTGLPHPPPMPSMPFHESLMMQPPPAPGHVQMVMRGGPPTLGPIPMTGVSAGHGPIPLQGVSPGFYASAQPQSHGSIPPQRAVVTQGHGIYSPIMVPTASSGIVSTPNYFVSPAGITHPMQSNLSHSALHPPPTQANPQIGTKEVPPQVEPFQNLPSSVNRLSALSKNRHLQHKVPKATDEQALLDYMNPDTSIAIPEFLNSFYTTMMDATVDQTNNETTMDEDGSGWLDAAALFAKELMGIKNRIHKLEQIKADKTYQPRPTTSSTFTQTEYGSETPSGSPIPNTLASVVEKLADLPKLPVAESGKLAGADYNFKGIGAPSARASYSTPIVRQRRYYPSRALFKETITHEKLLKELTTAKFFRPTMGK